MFLELLLLACAPDDPGEDDAPVAVQVVCAPVTTGDVDDTLALRGPIRPPPDRDAQVVPLVAGVVTSIAAREGAAVHRGDVLATLDDRAARAASTASDAEAGAARARATQLRAAAVRKAGLLQRGIVSRAEADAAEADAAEAEAASRRADADADAARQALERTRLTSPIDGVVLRVARHVGETVDPDTHEPMVEIVDAGALELDAQVAAGDLARLAAGQAARVDVGADAPLEARVAAVAPGVDGASGLGAVRLTLTPPVAVPVGTIGRADVIVAHRSGVRTVPSAAVRGGAQGGHEVVMCADGHARVATVQLGASADGRVEVTGELPADARVVVEGVLALEDGAALAEGAATGAPE